VSWALAPGVLELPDGVRLLGRSLRRDAPPEPPPEWGLYLLVREPDVQPWESRWLRWPDFWLPSSPEDARAAFAEAHARAAAGARIEIACGGGLGRTGTALACIAILAGVSPAHATAWVREHYDVRAVETPWQRRYVRRFTAPSG
jgi:protein-tyrosine phosphatase